LTPETKLRMKMMLRRGLQFVRLMMRARRFCCLSVLLALQSPALAADQFDSLISDEPSLANLSIEELAQIPVRSASKRVEPLGSVPAALFVITGDEAVDGGALTLPEALRLAPNLNVQQSDASQYSITARGFNGIQASNKLLALIDGRTIYTPLAASVFWDLHLPLLEDVRQIEVISGPGGTLYGPNAVNGVINILSRDAQDTLGTLARGSAGANEQSLALRHGLALGGNAALRVYGQYTTRDRLPSRLIGLTDDRYRGWQTGFRSDVVTDRDQVTLQGDLFRTRVHTGREDGATGHNLLARWSRSLSSAASFQVQAYYDRFERTFTQVDDRLETFDVEGQANLTLGSHRLVAGVGVRTTDDEFVNKLNMFNLNPTSRRLWIGNAFLQDQWQLTPSLWLTAGLKIERSTFTGLQVLPNVRLAWQASDRHLLWTAISRAVRTPSRIDRQLEAQPFLLAAPNFASEKVIAFEAGYRGQPAAQTSLSLNAFVNRYDDLRTTELINDSFQLRNGKQGNTYGIEGWGTAQLHASFRLSLGFATLWKDLKDKPGRVDLIPRNSIGNDPEWQLTARSEVNLAPGLRLVLDGRSVGEIKQAPVIDGYTELAGQLSWAVRPQFELFVSGRNLLKRSHAENNDFAAQLPTRSLTVGARTRL
jgi:iron complex outermembrane receptor protein